METPTPEFLQQFATKSPDRQLQEDLEKEGWQLAGIEYPSRTPWNPDTGRFEKKRIKSDNEIKEEYVSKHGSGGFNEVRLEYHRKEVADQIIEDDTQVFVYMRHERDTQEKS